MRKRVLIVDDDARNIFALKATLKSRGFECASCDNAGSAIELLHTDDKIDVVLMDMMMPEIDGYTAIPIIRAIPGRERLPIIAVTAQAMPGDREKCLSAGADNYVVKPIDVDALLNILAD